MNALNRLAISLVAIAVAAGPALAAVKAPAYSTLGVGGYYLVSYQTGKKPVRGNGNHLVVHDGVTYLFSSDANKATCEKAPDKYLPAYGGYCAFGVSVGAKFVGDPDVWEIVDGRLYLNLDNS
ncbi:MAG: YHS domain protein, partial [Myxococcales bacterium]